MMSLSLKYRTIGCPFLNIEVFKKKLLRLPRKRIKQMEKWSPTRIGNKHLFKSVQPFLGAILQSSSRVLMLVPCCPLHSDPKPRQQLVSFPTAYRPSLFFNIILSYQTCIIIQYNIYMYCMYAYIYNYICVCVYLYIYLFVYVWYGMECNVM